MNELEATIEGNLNAAKLIHDAAARGNGICGAYMVLAMGVEKMGFGIDDSIDYEDGYDACDEAGMY